MAVYVCGTLGKESQLLRGDQDAVFEEEEEVIRTCQVHKIGELDSCPQQEPLLHPVAEQTMVIASADYGLTTPLSSASPASPPMWPSVSDHTDSHDDDHTNYSLLSSTTHHNHETNC